MPSTAPAVASGDLILTLSCPDQPGIVYAVSGFLAERGCNIVESQQFDDRESGAFFMRVQFTPIGERAIDPDDLRRDFGAIADRFTMSWRLAPATHKPRVLIMVSRFGHCLNDLLYRAGTGDLNIDVVSVVSNHPDLGAMADSYNVPFHHIPVTPRTKPAAEAELLDLVNEMQVELVVLARYMQILSTDLCKRLEGRAINIHHSMLPSFKGARPYSQAHDRGVKLVGATAHYVTADLDEGPIIAQEVARVDHAMTVEEVTALGRDNECLALARAVRWHAENRTLLNGHRTVVFSR
ncbi:formyltetrahydrofolate deformylase [Actinoallomurus sp. NBC_01490]|uniref:formyltetrahydrofolate deformylase n=1 Tax=Actinoallomurus sp. NBC_01490 TaxID=2903557 RepID=UPI002E2F9AD1|nr:formyltetrahydrofolate deformylase [Actinoallomurus sp. NBC_01490]